MYKFSTFVQEQEVLSENITPQELANLEKFADEIWGKLKIDVEFTRHFYDRLNDNRNNPPITKEEMRDFFKKAFKKYGGKIRQLGKSAEAVLTQLSTDLNLPFALEFDPKTGELDLITKTIMRKDKFKTSGTHLKFQ